MFAPSALGALGEAGHCGAWQASGPPSLREEKGKEEISPAGDVAVGG